MDQPKQSRLFGRPIKIVTPKDKKVKEKEEGVKLASISYSSIKDYLACPKLFYYRDLLKIRLPEKKMELVFGTGVHAAFEAYTKGEDLRAAFTKAFDPKLLESEELTNGRFDEHTKEGERFIQVFLDSQQYFKDVWNLELKGKPERMFRTWMKDPITKSMLPVAFSGRVDFETDAGQIIDYKTSSKLYKQDEVDNNLQPSYYILEYLARTGKMPEGFYYLIFVKGRKEPLQVVRTTRTKEQLSLAFKMAELVVNGVKAGNFPRGSGWMHKFCQCEQYEKALLI